MAGGIARAAAIRAHSSAKLQKNVGCSLKILELFKRIAEDGRRWQRMERSEGLGVEKEY